MTAEANGAAAARVLVATATEHAATRETGAAIGRVLEEAGLDVSLAPARGVETLAGWDGVVVGSAAHASRQLRDAHDLVDERIHELDGTSVWLFFTGAPRPVARTSEALATHARELRIFPGTIRGPDEAYLERAAVPITVEGDAGCPGAVETWAEGIAETLTERS